MTATGGEARCCKEPTSKYCPAKLPGRYSAAYAPAGRAAAIRHILKMFSISADGEE